MQSGKLIAKMQIGLKGKIFSHDFFYAAIFFLDKYQQLCKNINL